MNVKVGDSVIVKPNTIDPDLGIDLGGWQGRISQVSETENLVCIDWDSITLKAIPDAAIAKSEEEGLEWSQIYLYATEVERSAPRDTQEEVDRILYRIQVKHAWDYLGEEGRYIRQVMADIDPDDEWAVFSAWESNLRKVLSFPFEAKVTEFQERGRLQVDDKVIVQEIADVDDLYGVLVAIEHKREAHVFPLCDLEAIHTKSPNYEYVRAYAVWFANR